MADDDILDITVRCMDGQSVNLQVPRDLQVADLKILVEEQTNIPPGRQRFIFHGQPLQPNRSLSDYNVGSGHTIHLVTRHADSSSQTADSAASNASTSTSFSGSTVTMPQWQGFPINLPGGNPGHVMVGQMHIAHGSDTTTTSWSSSSTTAATPATNDIFNSLIHSIAHSAATSVASVAASNAVAQLGLSPGVIANTSFSFSLPTMTSVTSNPSTQFSGSSSSSTTGTNAITAFPTAAFQGNQRFGPFVMGEYNGIPVAIGGALVGGTPISPRVYVSGFSSAAAGETTSTGSEVTSSSQSITIEAVSSNISGTGTNSSQAEGTSSVPVTTASEGAFTAAQRPRNQENGLGALISNIIQHITPTVTSMTANAVSRYMPAMERQGRETNTRNNSSRATRTEESTIEARADNSNAAETMRQGLNEFMNSISDVLGSAGQTIGEARERTLRLGLQADTSDGSTLNTGLGNAGTNARQRLYISNDYVNDRLPWQALNQLLDLLQEETGWRRPRMQLPPTPNTLGAGPGPISVFLSAYGQVTNILQTLFLQIQAWQEGFAALDVPRFGRTVQALAHAAQINAQLSSLLAWIFQNMVEHVDPENLNSAMGWDSHVVANRTSASLEAANDRTEQGANTAAEGTRNVISVAFEDKRSNDEMNEDSVSVNRNDEGNKNEALSDDEMKSAHESFISEEATGNSVHAHSSPIMCINERSQVQVSSSERVDNEVGEMPEEVMRRFRNWTSDPVNFSKQVLRDARQEPLSSAYISGDATASRSLRDATQEAADRIFSLNWHRSLNKTNITDEHEAPQELNEMYMAQTMRDLAENARNNLDYQQESSHYPGIRRALQYIDELRTTAFSEENEDKEKSDDVIAVKSRN